MIWCLPLFFFSSVLLTLETYVSWSGDPEGEPETSG